MQSRENSTVLNLEVSTPTHDAAVYQGLRLFQWQEFKELRLQTDEELGF